MCDAPGCPSSRCAATPFPCASQPSGKVTVRTAFQSLCSKFAALANNEAMALWPNSHLQATKEHAVSVLEHDMPECFANNPQITSSCVLVCCLMFADFPEAVHAGGRAAGGHLHLHRRWPPSRRLHGRPGVLLPASTCCCSSTRETVTCKAGLELPSTVLP